MTRHRDEPGWAPGAFAAAFDIDTVAGWHSDDCMDRGTIPLPCNCGAEEYRDMVNQRRLLDAGGDE